MDFVKTNRQSPGLARNNHMDIEKLIWKSNLGDTQLMALIS